MHACQASVQDDQVSTGGTDEAYPGTLHAFASWHVHIRTDRRSAAIGLCYWVHALRALPWALDPCVLASLVVTLIMETLGFRVRQERSRCCLQQFAHQRSV